jgi:single-strand DNA-binding protein
MLNNCIFLGRLTADPEAKTTQSGATYTNFTIAVDRDYSKGEEKQADFINCVAFSKSAEFVAKWFKKGSPIVVVGRLEMDRYTDKDGNKRTSYKINAREVSFVPNTKQTEDTNETPNFTEIPDNDLPFSM